MKTVFILAILQLAFSHSLEAKKPTIKNVSKIISLKADDFVLMSLGSVFSHNVSCIPSMGYGLFFQRGNDPHEIKVIGCYANNAQQKSLNGLYATIEIYFHDLVERYDIKDTFKLKKVFGKI